MYSKISKIEKTQFSIFFTYSLYREIGSIVCICAHVSKYAPANIGCLRANMCWSLAARLMTSNSDVRLIDDVI